MSTSLVSLSAARLLRFVRDEYETTLELAPHPDGWQLVSRSGTRFDGTERRLVDADRAVLVAEMERVARALAAHGRVLVERREAAEQAAC
jgi:hypothetical protein